MQDDDASPGAARAGAAFAARRQELGISQRQLARLKVISGSSLSAFEKGRSWPRERTRATLEEVVQWPAGTLAKIRAGGAVPGTQVAPPGRTDTEVPLIADAVDVAMTAVTAAIANLPADDHPKFAEHVQAVLADLRKLEAITARAVHTSQGAPALIKSLAAVRRRYDELMARAAAAPGATLGQRLYTARRLANLTVAETAAALDAPIELVIAVESETPAPDDAASRIEELIEKLASA
ncbi:helix-turn-helix domain-containing protein [uncultured Mycobacterium sp.]|uniref:helix-turn-helix domain-containing protein n=1 Tax=uncultured Mycobacterium sp. TaxID=171292 RepID=UPI0035CB128C